MLFYDFFPVLLNPTIFELVIGHLQNHISTTVEKVDVIAGLESRGFLLGPILASRLGVAFVPIRKKGKLPGKTESVTFTLEYGQDDLEIQCESIKPGQKVILIDDLIATGGTASAAVGLVQKVQGEVVKFLFVMEIDELKGREKLKVGVYSMIHY